MFPNKHPSYSVPPACLYQSNYPNYPDGEVHHVPHLDNGIDCNNQGFQTWSNFFPNSNRMSNFDQLMLMNHTNQFYTELSGNFSKNCSQIQDCTNPAERIQGDIQNFDGRRSTESAVAVSSDGIRSCSVSPEMTVNYSLNNNRSPVKPPQMPRPEFEWMTKTSYQSQPNPGKWFLSILQWCYKSCRE